MCYVFVQFAMSTTNADSEYVKNRLSLGRTRASAHFSLSSERRTIKWNLSCHFYSLWHPRSSEIRILCRAHIVPIPYIDSVHISLRHCKWMRDCDVLSHNRCCLRGLWMRRCELRFNKWRDWRASKTETEIEAQKRDKQRRMHIVVDVRLWHQEKWTAHSRSHTNTLTRLIRKHTHTHTSKRS